MTIFGFIDDKGKSFVFTQQKAIIIPVKMGNIFIGPFIEVFLWVTLYHCKISISLKIVLDKEIKMRIKVICFFPRLLFRVPGIY